MSSVSSRSVLIILHGGKAYDVPGLREEIAQQRQQGHRIEVRVTWEAGDAVRFARQGAEEGVDLLVAAGGDGTLNEVIRGIFEAGRLHACSAGVLPLGTGNDFATTCGFDSTDAAENLRRLLSTPPTLLDLGLVNGQPFVNMATAGFGSEVTVETPEELKNLLGRAAYLLTGLRRFTSLTARHGRIASAEVCWEGAFYFLAIGNGRQAGGGRVLFPEASLTDGLLDLFVLPELQADQVLSTIPRLMTEGLSAIESEGFKYRSRWFEVVVPEGLHVNLDGQPIEGSTFRFEVLPAALSFHVYGGGE